jgi:hypothetical protein
MMMKKVVTILMLSLAFSACVIGETGAQAEYTINIKNTRWDHSTIRILLIPQENEPWWNSTFVDLTVQAIDMWNNALTTFASKYPDFAYISNITLASVESTGTAQNFDVYVSWKEQISGGFEVAGTAQQYVNSSGIVKSCNITLAAKDMLGVPITDIAKQTVAVHEIGHALGLNHANYTDDVMYSQTSFDIAVRPISTLDVYGVAQVFGWRSFSSQFNSSSQKRGPDSVSLPSSGINYEYLNEPQQDQLIKFISYFLRYFQTLEGLMMLIVFSFIILGTATIVSALHRKKHSLPSD